MATAPADTIFRIEHGDNTAEYTDWDVARATLVKQLQDQWTNTKGAPGTKSEANGRLKTIDSVILDSMTGANHGIGGVRLRLTGIDYKAATPDRLEAAEATTAAAREALNTKAAA